MVGLTIFGMFQSPIQGLFKPGWCPGIRNFHGHQESWKCNDSIDDRKKDILQALERIIQEDTTGSFYDIQKCTSDFIRIYVFTWAEWLDIIEIKLTDKNTHVKSYSSGVLPLSIPFACVLNLVLFWVPFLDRGLNKKRIYNLREKMTLPFEVSTNNS